MPSSFSKQPILSDSAYSNFGSTEDNSAFQETSRFKENLYDYHKKRRKIIDFCSTIFERTRSFLKVRNLILRQFLAEIFGTFIFLAFSFGGVAQFLFSGKTNFFSANVSFGLGLTMAIIAVGKISGAHLNPAVSFSMLLLGKLPLFSFGIYVIGQFIGAFLASVMVFLVYLNQLSKYPAGMNSIETAGIFGTYPNDVNDPSNTFSMFCDQFFGTFLFIICILAVTDKKNTEMSHEMVAVLIGFAMVIIGSSFGFNCGFAVNPARDLSPRIFTAIAGWGSKTFTAGNYFFWIPIVAPMLGSAFGTLVYGLIVSNNWPDY